MSDEFKVWVFKRKGRKFFEAEWRDPVTGRKVTRSTKKAKRRDAERVAGILADQVRSGRFLDAARVTWAEFRERHESEVQTSLADGTGDKLAATFNAIERLITPNRLASLDAGQISRFQQKLRDEGLSEPSIKSHLSHLKSALRWAHRVGLLAAVPRIDMPKRASGSAKGRPITTEEFERMLAAVPKVVVEDPPGGWDSLSPAEADAKRERDAAVVASWRFLLRGLWWSGLRLGEALDLHWTDDRRLCVDFAGKRPMFRIHADAQKSNEHQLLTMAPEFAEFLQATPLDGRDGYLFNPEPIRGQTGRPGLDWVSRVISSIGREAKVKVSDKKQLRKRKDKAAAEAQPVKYASAHDFRRAFGFRWSVRVMPAILQKLMRHKSITTTMEFYVGRDAEAAADVVWQAFSDTSSDSRPSLTSTADEPTPQTEQRQ